ncbi:MAG: hypothetical protein V7L01_15480 [Nostoc sp.]|uniref:hypothetical protein n=1 Tax=Nostoc sp. TaxID=1180 RepID=UPI002FF7FBFB
MNRRLYKRLIIVETAIYRVFVMIYGIFSDLEFSSKNINQTVFFYILIRVIRADSQHL